MRGLLSIFVLFLSCIFSLGQTYKYKLTNGWTAMKLLELSPDSLLVVGLRSQNLGADYMKHRWSFDLMNMELNILKTDTFHLQEAISTTFHTAFSINNMPSERCFRVAGGVSYADDTSKAFSVKFNYNLQEQGHHIQTKGYLHYTIASLQRENTFFDFSTFIDNTSKGANSLLTSTDSSLPMDSEIVFHCNAYSKYDGCNFDPRQILPADNSCLILALNLRPVAIPYAPIEDGLILKVDSQGNELWRLELEDDSTTCHNLLIAPLANGNFLATYQDYYHKPYKAPRGTNRWPEPNESLTTQFIEFNASGVILREWNLKSTLKDIFFYEPQPNFLKHLIVSNDSSILITGGTSNVGKYGTDLGFLLKIDKKGKYQWYRQYEINIAKPNSSGKQELYLNGVTELSNGNYALAGEYRSDPSDSFPTGTQQGIVLFVDSFGCLEPGCQANDNVGIENPRDSHPQQSGRIDFTVYPNPSNGVIQIINSKSQAPKTIAIYDMQGRSANFVQHGTSFTLDCPAGIYYVRLVREDGYSEIHKFVIQ